jgi:type IV secretion system protein VirB4
MNAHAKIEAARPPKPRVRPADRAKLMAAEKPAGARLPYAHHLNDTVVRLRAGELMSVIRLDGFPFETADAAELDYRQGVRSTMLRSIASSHFAVYQHVIRRRVRPYPDGDYADPFCRALNEAWKRRVSEGALFVNDLYLTLIRRPLQGKVGLVDQALRLVRAKVDGEAARVREEKDLRDLDAAVDGLLGVLQPYGARLLSVYDTPNGACSEPLEFLSCLYNDELRSVLLPHADLGHHLPYKRVSFGDEAFELRGATPAGDRVGAIVSVKDYPTSTHAGMMDALMRLPHELVVSQSFAFLDRQVTVDRMKLNLRRLRTASDDETRSLRTDMEGALDDVTYGRSAYGEHHMTVQVKAPTLAQLDDAVSDVMASFTDLGVIAVREDLNLEPAFWAQFPGNLKDVARRSGISTGNFAAFASLHNFPVGKPHGNHWGPAVTMLETTSGTPYFLSFHKGDVGNFTLIGATGFGKTVLATFLVAQAQKFAPRTVYFDKDRGAEIFIRAIRGSYAVIRPGQPTGFNPLALPDSQENRAFLRRWIGKLVAVPSEALTAEELADIADAVDANFDQAPEYRNLAHFAELFRGKRRASPGDLAARLAKWHSGGSHAWAFDNDLDALDLEAATLGFDMTHVLDDPELRTPVMMYLFHRIEQRLDGTPTIIVVDEGWKALDDEEFEARIKDWEKTIRKRNGLVGFITQSAGDALRSKVGSAIIEQSPTQFFLPNPKARAEEYCQGFGLTEYELEIVRGLPDTSRCFLVKQGNDAVIARLDLTGYSEILAVLSGRETSVRVVDELRQRHGDEPRAWLPPFISHLRHEGAPA